MAKKEEDQNLKAALAYLLGFVTGIFFLMTEKENEFIRFHARQSIIVFGILFVLYFVPLVNFFVIPISLLAWLFLMYKAYSGEKYKLPYIGGFAEKQF